MASYYSIIRFVNNALSDESIALGLVVLTSDSRGGSALRDSSSLEEAKAIVRISPEKVEFAKKLNPTCAKLLEFSLGQVHKFLKQDLADQSGQIVQFPVRLKHEFLERLASYNNGLLQFSKPRFIESENMSVAFDRYYTKFIEANVPIAPKEVQPVESELHMRVQHDLYEPLRGRIDVDYTLRKRRLPSLFFDFHLDGIGVNGGIHAVKAIDLNSKQHIDTIQRQLSEYESVIERLNKFAPQKDIKGQPRYYLVVDPYEGINKDRKELYELLKDQAMLPFEVVRSNKLSGISEYFRKVNVRKFSEVLDE